MSDTPKADALQDSFATVADWFEFARDLERENAELRTDVYCCPPTSENDYEGFKWSDACEELENENAALRAALERWQTLATEGLVHTLPPWMAGMVKNIAEQGQKALALRKEAQP